MNRLTTTLLAGLALAAVQGCSSYNVQNATPVGDVVEAHDIDPEYLIQVGDTVRVGIRTYDDPTNADVTEVIVRPDGKVFFPLIEDEVLLARRKLGLEYLAQPRGRVFAELCERHAGFVREIGDQLPLPARVVQGDEPPVSDRAHPGKQDHRGCKLVHVIDPMDAVPIE